MYDLNKISQLKKDNAEFAEALNSVENYYNIALSRINHEFGNALTLVNSSLQIIQSSHPEVNDFKYWDSTLEDVRHMVNLVREISTYNKSNTLKKEAVNLYDIASHVIKSYSAGELYPDINFTLESEAELPDINGDSLKLRQVIINLIKNAAESIENKGTVSVILCSDNSYIYLSVKDTGCGITKEQMKNIFTPLVSYKSNGNGLGLPIIKKIVDAHNGSITVDSTPGKGTTFSLSFTY